MCSLELKIGSNSTEKCICSIEPVKLNYVVKYSTLAPLMQAFFFLKALENQTNKVYIFAKGVLCSVLQYLCLALIAPGENIGFVSFMCLIVQDH